MVGATGASLMTISNACVSLPVSFVAFTVKLKVPSLSACQNGAVRQAQAVQADRALCRRDRRIPVAARPGCMLSFCAPGKFIVVMVGGTGASLMTISNACVSLPASFVAFTVKLKVPLAVGVPEMVSLCQARSDRRSPLSNVQVSAYPRGRQTLAVRSPFCATWQSGRGNGRRYRCCADDYF